MPTSRAFQVTTRKFSVCHLNKQKTLNRIEEEILMITFISSIKSGNFLCYLMYVPTVWPNEPMFQLCIESLLEHIGHSCHHSCLSVEALW